MQVRIFTYTVFVHVAMSDEEGLEEGEVEERLEAERGGEGRRCMRKRRETRSAEKNWKLLVSAWGRESNPRLDNTTEGWTVA